MLLCPWDSLGTDTGVGSHSLLQGIFLTQGSTWVSCFAGRFFTIWATREVQIRITSNLIILWSVLWIFIFSTFSFQAYIFFYFILFNFTILYWFCHISKWICHRYTCVPHPEPSSLLPPQFKQRFASWEICFILCMWNIFHQSQSIILSYFEVLSEFSGCILSSLLWLYLLQY